MSHSHIIFILALIIIVGGAFILFPKETPRGDQDTSHAVSVVTTLFPLYSMAQEIGNTHADVTLLLPPGTSPHSYEPTPSDMLAIAEADVFIYTGPFMEPWVADVLSGMDTSDMEIVDASANVEVHRGEADIHEEHGHEHGDEHEHEDHEEDARGEHDDHDHHHEEGDPHIWLSPSNALIIARDIGDAIARAYPEHASDIESARDAYIAKLNDVFTRYTETLLPCETRTLVYGGHYAFGYMAEAFDLTYVTAQGYSPDAEPTAANLATLVDIIEHENATAIFTNTLESPAIAETLARETGARVLLINPAGNVGKDIRDAGTTFIDILESNLSALSEGLRCE